MAPASTTRNRALIGVAVVAVVAAVVAAVLVLRDDGGDDPVEEVTTTTEPDSGPVAPLTGLRLDDGERAARPALVVKVDNLDTARESAVPQDGLLRADVVFEQIVEGDITRLVAVYQSQDPGRVGPVRSARTTDVILLPQLGRPLLAWSGGNDGVVEAVRSSPSIIDVGYSVASGSYHRSDDRPMPHNLYVDADELWGRAPEGTPPPPPLFSFRDDGEAAPDSASEAAGVDIVWGPGSASARVGWRWDDALELYVRSQRDQPHLDAGGTPLVAANVVILETPYGQSPADARSPEAQTVGAGKAIVYTDGRVVEGTWDRPTAEVPATLTDATGAEIELTPGQTWVELAREGTTSTVS